MRSPSLHGSAAGPSWPGAPGARGDRVLDLGRLLVGVVILATGGLFLLDAAGVLDAGNVIDDWWPSVIVAAGLLTLAERPPAVGRGLVLTAIGVVALLFTTGVLDESAWDYVWPAAVIAAGIAVLLHWSGRRIPAGAHPEDVIRTTAVFGGAEVASTDVPFRGAWLTAIFGGITLDCARRARDRTARRSTRPSPSAASTSSCRTAGA